MKPSRNLLLLAATLALGIGLGGFLLIQQRKEQSTSAVEATEAKHAEASPARAANEAVESMPVPIAEAILSDATDVSQRKEVDTQQLEILVLDPEGALVVDARVALFREEALLLDGSTGSDGSVRWRAQDGTAQYAIAAWGWAFARGEVELSAGRKTLTLPEGALIAGTALVDDAAPVEPFELRWRSDASAEEFSLPQAVWQGLRRPSFKFVSPVARTGPDGSFQFRGLRPDASGSLLWTAPYFLRGAPSERQARSLNLKAPRSDVRLDLSAGCELRLRVVDAARNPVPNAQVRLERRTGSAPAVGNSASCDEQGRCSIALSPEAFDRCSVSVAHEKSAAWKLHALTPPPVLCGVWDVGDLEATAARTVLVRVQDVEGRPIEGASVYAWKPPNPERRATTDASGMQSVLMAASDSKIAVEAFTYTSEIVEVSEGAAEVVATMQRNCVLEFVLSDPSLTHEGLTLELNGPSPMFDDAELQASLAPEKRRPRTATHESRSAASGGAADGTSTLMLQPGKDLRWRVASLRPHQPLRARLRGGGALVCEVQVPPLEPGEQRMVTFPILSPPRSLIVRVLSPDLQRVSGASIWTQEGEALRTSQRQLANADGEIELKSLFGERLSFVARGAPYAPKRVDLAPIPQGRFDVVLEPAESAEIELVHLDGSPYTAEVHLDSEATRWGELSTTPLGPGRYRLDGLPPGEVLLTAQGKFGALRRLHRSGDPLLRLVVDEPGVIAASIQGTPKDGKGVWMLELAAVGSSRALTRCGVYQAQPRWTEASFEGLPPGEYELRLLHAEVAIEDWAMEPLRRIGTPVRVVIDAEHESVKVDMALPR